jgi:hypothetical protein
VVRVVKSLFEKKYETQVSKIGGEKIRERKGKLAADLGKPAMQATAKELQSYIKGASGEVEKRKRVARVNLMRAHKAGLRAKGSRVPAPRAGK